MTFMRFYTPEVSRYRDENVNEAYDKLVHHFSSGCGCNQGALPATNISENDKEYRIEMALPGVAKKDIQISHEKDNMTIKINKADENKDAEGFTRREFDYSGTSRSFKTGSKVDSEHITAKYENGVLIVHLPKKEVTKEVHSISVE